MKKSGLIFYFISIFGVCNTALCNETSDIIAGGTDCGTNCAWKIENGTLILYGNSENSSGSMTYFSDGTSPWFNYRDSITSIKIEDGLENIGRNIFSGLTKATSISIPTSVKSIETYAFDGTDFSVVEIPNSVQNLGESLFVRNKNLIEVYCSEELAKSNNCGIYSRNGYGEGEMQCNWGKCGYSDKIISGYISSNGSNKEYYLSDGNGGFYKAKIIDKNGKITQYNADGSIQVDNTPVTSYTVATATKRVDEIGGCEDVKCSLKMWFK